MGFLCFSVLLLGANYSTARELWRTRPNNSASLHRMPRKDTTLATPMSDTDCELSGSNQLLSTVMAASKPMVSALSRSLSRLVAASSPAIASS